MKKLLISIVLIFSSVLSFTLQAQEWSFAQEFTHDFPENGDGQGNAMDIDSNRAIIGISGFDIFGAFGNAGAVLLLEKVNGVWQKDTLIVSQNPGWDDYFGHSVAIDDHRIAIGKILQDDNGNNSGSVVVMELNETTGIWENPQEFSSPGTVAYDQFGGTVALSGNWLAVTQKLDDYSGSNDVGSVDIFEYNGSSWIHKQNILSPHIGNGEGFGYAIELDADNNRLVISAPWRTITNSNSGAVYEYNLSGSTWDYTGEIWGTLGSNTLDGYALSLSGDRLISGSGSTLGYAHVFDWNSNTSNWDLSATIDDSGLSGITNSSKFGHEVFVDGDRILISAQEHDGSGSESGSVFVFEKEQGNFVLKDNIIPPTAEADQNFGVQVAILGNDVIINASAKDNDVTSNTNTGYTYIYNYCKKDSILNITTCDAYTNNQGMYNITGQYMDTIPAQNGCDSVIQLNLTILDPMDLDTTIVDTTICRDIDFIWPDGSIAENVQIPLIQYSTLIGVNGCDSVVKTSILFYEHPNISESITDASCGEQNGSILIDMSGGTVFDFVWNNGANTEDLEDISSNTYVLTATNEFGCSTTETFNVISTELILTGDVTNNPCNGLTVGTIDLTVTGASPFEFEWSNGAETEDVSNLSAGSYDVYVTNADGCQSSASFQVTEPNTFSFDADVTLATCGADDGSIDLSVFGGNGSNGFDWRDEGNSQVATSEDVSGISHGLYAVTVTDANGCIGVFQVNVSENGGPTIYLDSTYEASCNDDGALFTNIVSGNGIQSILWSNNDNSEDITNLTSGDYVITVTDNSGCIGNAIFEVPNAIPTLTQICLVTVDQNTNSNLVVWEKPVSTDISSFVVYRESAVGGQYQVVDTVPYADESVLTDSTAFPHIRSWKYKIGTINSCGIESQLSPMHKTVHCAISQGVGSLYNIFWDEYIGFDYTTFEVWRHTATNGWENIQSLAIGNTSYTDTPPETTALDYYVSVTAPSTCSSSKANDYNSSRSNRTAGIFEPVDTTASILSFNSNDLSIYPNPFKNNITVTSKEALLKISITDVNGKTVLNEQLISGDILKLHHLDKGIYFIEIKDGINIHREKIVKN